jgi:hypothetical protein
MNSLFFKVQVLTTFYYRVTHAPMPTKIVTFLSITRLEYSLTNLQGVFVIDCEGFKGKTQSDMLKEVNRP